MRKNAFANLIGRIYSSALRALLLPLYLQSIGVEGYGVVGFYVTLRNLLSLLDFGLGAAFTREIAQLSASDDPQAARKQRELLNTLELVYWGVAVVAGGAVVALAPWIAHKWLHPQHISYDALQTAVRLMGIAISIQFPLALYTGGLIGLQRQVTANVLTVVNGTLQDVGVLLALRYLSPSVTMFLGWHVATSVVWVIAAGIVLRTAVPAVHAARRFSRGALAAVWVFAAGWVGNSAAAALLGQADKIIAVRFLTLQQFGYYAIAQSIAMFIVTLTGPIQIAAFPRFSQLAAARDEEALGAEYEHATALLALLVFPAAAVLTIFAHPVILVWTNKADVAATAGALLPIFAAGAVMAALASIPNSVQLAFGWFRAILTISFTAGICGVPALLVAAHFWGTRGLATVWALESTALLAAVPFLHRRILRGLAFTWLRRDVLVPLAAAAAVVLLLRFALPFGANRLVSLATLGLVWLCATCAVAASAPMLRSTFRSGVARVRLAVSGIR